MAGSLLVSYTRARGESLGVLCKEGLMQRAERLVLTILVLLARSHPGGSLGPGGRHAVDLGAGRDRGRHLPDRRAPDGLDLAPAALAGC